MKIFSLLPAYSNPQTNNNKNLNNSQNPQQAPKLKALSHDQVSFKSEIYLESGNIILKNMDELLPKFMKHYGEDFIEVLKRKIKKHGVVIRVFANKLSEGARRCTSENRNTALWIQVRTQGEEGPWNHYVPKATLSCPDEVNDQGQLTRRGEVSYKEVLETLEMALTRYVKCH